MYREQGRHPVYAKGKHVPGIQKSRSLRLPVVQAILAEDEDPQARKAVTPYLVEEEEAAATV